MHGPTFVTDLAIVLGVAAGTSLLARKFKQPTILGYLLAGLIVGPYLPIPLFADAERVESLAEFGVILVMFAIGLEFRLGRLIKVLPVSGLTGLVQIGFLLWCGFSLGQLFGWGTVESVFLGSCVAISSTMVVSRVFAQTPVPNDVRQFVLGVLVIQDLVAIVLIAAMTALAAGGGLAPGELGSMLGELAAVLLIMLVAGLLAVPRIVRVAARFRSNEILAVVAVGICFMTALLAEKFGYSVALGAFLAGILVAESGRGGKVEHVIEPLRDVFAAIFFVSIGMTVDPGQAWEHLPTALLVAAVVVAAQFGSVSIAGVLSGNGLRRSLVSGLALGQIGEFAFIIAGIGIGAGVVRRELQPVLVTVAVMTALTTPLLLNAGDRLVGWVDRRLPHRFQHLLSLYEQWLDGFRSRRRRPGDPRPARRALRAVGVDGLALTVLLAAAVVWLSQASLWLSHRLALEVQQARWILEAAVAVAAAPLLYGLVRNALSLARLVGASIQPPGSASGPAASIAAGTLQVMVHLGVLLGVGIPMVALLRPLIGAPYGSAALGAAVLAVIYRLWRSAGAVEREFQTGAAQIAQLLAEQTDAGAAEPATELLPGLDNFVQLSLPVGCHAVGKTLIDLQLRARTGATVVAIQRGQATAQLPTGREKLQPGDRLAIIGTREAVERAQKVLVAGAGDRPPGEEAPAEARR